MLYIRFCDLGGCDIHTIFFSQGGGYMFEFDNVANRDLGRDFVGNAHSVVSEWHLE